MIDVSIYLYAAEKREFFMNSTTFFTRADSVKVLVESLLCVWPLVDTVKCQVSVHSSHFEALKLFLRRGEVCHQFLAAVAHNQLQFILLVQPKCTFQETVNACCNAPTNNTVTKNFFKNECPSFIFVTHFTVWRNLGRVQPSLFAEGPFAFI